MEIEAQRGAAFANFADGLCATFTIDADDLVDVAGAFEQWREHVVEDNGDAQVGACRLEQLQGGRCEYGIAQRTQPNDDDGGVLGKLVENAQ